MEAYGAQLHPAGYSLTAYQENRKPRYLRATQFSAFGTVASQLAKITCPTGRQYIENRFQRQTASPGPWCRGVRHDSSRSRAGCGGTL